MIQKRPTFILFFKLLQSNYVFSPDTNGKQQIQGISVLDSLVFVELIVFLLCVVVVGGEMVADSGGEGAPVFLAFHLADAVEDAEL